jgi:hypothetical protein
VNNRSMVVQYFQDQVLNTKVLAKQTRGLVSASTSVSSATPFVRRRRTRCRQL